MQNSLYPMTTIFYQTRCKARRLSNPILFQCWLGTRDEEKKNRIQYCGLHCGPNGLLTNVRYGDDLMLNARSDTDPAIMVEFLVEELAAAGLILTLPRPKF